MGKKLTSVKIDEELLSKAKQYGINVSAFLEIKLREHIALIEGKSIALREGFEPSRGTSPTGSQGLRLSPGLATSAQNEYREV